MTFVVLPLVLTFNLWNLLIGSKLGKKKKIGFSSEKEIATTFCFKYNFCQKCHLASMKDRLNEPFWFQNGSYWGQFFCLFHSVSFPIDKMTTNFGPKWRQIWAKNVSVQKPLSDNFFHSDQLFALIIFWFEVVDKIRTTDPHNLYGIKNNKERLLAVEKSP